ncbi:MAG: tail fiber domain-containing protein [Rhodospirillales bacterium]|nr:tail fiber domain-containing protein [Rhodospirillales bacterium]
MLAAAPARAQEAVPGDVCGTVGAFRQSTGTDQTQGGYFLFCDGANWQRVISYSSTGDLELARTGAVTLPAGTDAMRPLSPSAGMIRFSSTATEFEGYDGSAWNTFGGLIDTVTGEPAPGFNFVLNDLGDVSAAAPNGGECLTWNGSAWVNSACGESLGTVAGAPAPTFNYLLNDLTDVSAAGPSSGECLTWNGANWVNGVCGSGVDIVAGQPLPSSNFLLDDLFDVDASGPSDGDVVFYSTGAAGWVTGAFGGGGTPAGSSQQIQLNSGGVFAADTNFVYTSAGDFVVGSYQLDDTGTGSEDYRMFFDRSKGALRAGWTDNTQWNSGSVGNLSFGFGANVRPTGSNSFAAGTNQVASGTNAIALGHDGIVSGSHAVGLGWATDATGNSSVSIGYWTFANANYSLVMGHEARTLGAHSFALGLGNSSTGSFPQVSGTSSFGIFMGDQQGVDITQSNAMVLMGGKFGIGDTTPDVELDVVGDIDYTGILTDVSDRRMKTDIAALPGGQLEKLMALQGVSFKMKDDPEARTELGLIAQDVEAVYPALVKESGSGIKSLNYMGLIGPMIEGMRELKAENDALRARIEALEAERSQERD